jgi:hypothetical protein
LIDAGTGPQPTPRRNLSILFSSPPLAGAANRGYFATLAELYEEMGLVGEWCALNEEKGRLTPREMSALLKGGFKSLWRVQYEHDLPERRAGHDRAVLCARPASRTRLSYPCMKP